MLNKLLFIVVFTSFVFCACIGIYVYKIDKKTLTNHSFFILCINISCWSIGYVFRLEAATKELANFWRLVSAFGWSFFYSSWVYFAFTIKYKGKKVLSNKQLFLLYIPSIIVYLSNFKYKPQEVFIKGQHGWDINYPLDACRIFFIIYYISFTIAGVAIIYSWGRNSLRKREKKQANIMLVSVIFVLILGTITEFILPMLGITPFPVAVILISIGMISIWYLIHKYKVIPISPEFVSEYIFKAVKDPILFLNEDFCIENANEAAYSITEYNKEELKNKLINLIFEENYYSFYSLLKEKHLVNAEVEVMTKSNKKIPCLLSGNVIYDEFNDVLGIVLVLHNISEIKKSEELLKNYNVKLEHKVKERTLKLQKSNTLLKKEISDRRAAEEKIKQMIYNDELTGLPNRRYFNNYIAEYISNIKCEEKCFAVMFLDLDNFKSINDTYGHQKGDMLLQQVSQKIKNIIDDNSILARIGGDEFLILVTNLSKEMHIEKINLLASRIMSVLKEPFWVNNKENFIGVSIGTAFYPNDGQDAETLIRNADIALYEAKNMGRNNIKICTQEIKNKVIERTNLINNLHRALEKGELFVYYQPKVDIKLNKISGFEALLRWKPNNDFFVSPSEFIPLTEETKLIVPIGYWVIKTACKNLKQWHNRGFTDLTMAINLSYNQLNEKNFLSTVENILKEVGLEPCFLEFEITERVTLKGIEENVKVLEQMKNMGIKISIDDFGTDNSSFVNIKRIPVDKIKIAVDFIEELFHDEKDVIIVNSIIKFAHDLQFKVIAEGVQTREQLEYLKNIGCDEVQGYYYYKPMSDTEAYKVLTEEFRKNI